MDIFTQNSDIETKEGPPVYSVTQISLSLKSLIEDTFQGIHIKGEISGAKIHSSGHVYFSLKDEKAVIDAVCWRGNATFLKQHIEDGLEVICRGKITTYMGRSKYQIIVDHLEPAGKGALLKLLEERKKKFLEEGLFLPERKKKLPFLPTTIGIITSPTGAVIRDILHRLKDRCPRHVLLWPVNVQGQGAEGEITSAIEGFNKLPLTFPRPDVLILARGGGSIEDLWTFNEETTVRAVANSQIPIITAVGHETDTTLVDFASDVRAPTPTAAAEIAVPVAKDLLTHLDHLSLRLQNTLTRHVNEQNRYLQTLFKGIRTPRFLVEERMQLMDELGARLTLAFKNYFKHLNTRLSHVKERMPSPKTSLLPFQDKLSHTSSLLSAFSYKHTLERGFSIIRTKKGTIIRKKDQVKTGDALELHVQDGKISTVVTEPNLL